MKSVITTLIILIIFSNVMAQHQEVTEKPDMYKGKHTLSADTNNLLTAFKRGQINGHFRYFFMHTDNQKGLSDYYANAAGGGLRYETARFYNFQFAVSGFYTFNIGSSDLGIPDSVTKQSNRYEIALFDIENPYNKKDIDRLEELYLKYNFKTSNLTFGRQLLNTPFINLQDGRMRPTGVEGIWLSFNEIKKLRFEGGFLYAISPRGTTKWYSIQESIGIYPSGVNSNGTKSQYANNLVKSNVLIAGTHYTPSMYFSFHAWEQMLPSIFNTAMLQGDFQYALKNKKIIFVSAQGIHQLALKDGGNESANKTYFTKNGKSLSFGARAGIRNSRWEFSLNYNRITKHGRYLMPREFGREPFFTFLPRERNEGLGDVHAMLTKINYSIPKANLKTSIAAGYYQLPDVKNYELNKYGLPSYIQVNGDIRYQFSGIAKGMEAQLLVTGKINKGETYNNKKYEINKVNMILYNFVLNYHF